MKRGKRQNGKRIQPAIRQNGKRGNNEIAFNGAGWSGGASRRMKHSGFSRNVEYFSRAFGAVDAKGKSVEGAKGDRQRRPGVCDSRDRAPWRPIGGPELKNARRHGIGPKDGRDVTHTPELPGGAPMLP